MSPCNLNNGLVGYRNPKLEIVSFITVRVPGVANEGPMPV